jgi:hypothetical protein
MMREGQNFVMHLGIWNKETEVNTWQTYSQQELRNPEFAKEWTFGTLTEMLNLVKITDKLTSMCGT